MVRAEHEYGKSLFSRLLADRFDKVGAGCALHPRPHETAQHDNGKAVRCDKSGPPIGCAKIGSLLQLHNMIEIECADAKVITVFCCRYDRSNALRHRINIDVAPSD